MSTQEERPWWQPATNEKHYWMSFLYEMTGGSSSPDEVAFFDQWQEPVWVETEAEATALATELSHGGSRQTLTAPVPAGHPSYSGGVLVYVESADWKRRHANA